MRPLSPLGTCCCSRHLSQRFKQFHLRSEAENPEPGCRRPRQCCLEASSTHPFALKTLVCVLSTHACAVLNTLVIAWWRVQAAEAGRAAEAGLARAAKREADVEAEGVRARDLLSVREAAVMQAEKAAEAREVALAEQERTAAAHDALMRHLEATAEARPAKGVEGSAPDAQSGADATLDSACSGGVYPEAGPVHPEAGLSGTDGAAHPPSTTSSDEATAERQKILEASARLQEREGAVEARELRAAALEAQLQQAQLQQAQLQQAQLQQAQLEQAQLQQAQLQQAYEWGLGWGGVEGGAAPIAGLDPGCSVGASPLVRSSSGPLGPLGF